MTVPAHESLCGLSDCIVDKLSLYVQQWNVWSLSYCEEFHCHVIAPLQIGHHKQAFSFDNALEVRIDSDTI